MDRLKFELNYATVVFNEIRWTCLVNRFMLISDFVNGLQMLAENGFGLVLIFRMISCFVNVKEVCKIHSDWRYA